MYMYRKMVCQYNNYYYIHRHNILDISSHYTIFLSFIDPVWKVARYTSATPMFFSECDNYIDGGVICNNPTEYGLTAIQNFFRQQGKRLPIALVVSIGTGVYPAEELGSIDLFLGIGTLTRIKQRTQNLISLLGNAVGCIFYGSNYHTLAINLISDYGEIMQ